MDQGDEPGGRARALVKAAVALNAAAAKKQ